jgi:hypothetical protein
MDTAEFYRSLSSRIRGYRLNVMNTDRCWVRWLPVIVVLAWLAVGFVLPRLSLDNADSRGLFGDQFGAVNALFSGLAFAVIYQTLRMQKQDNERTIALTALASYTDITRTLWLQNETKSKTETPPPGCTSWDHAIQTRYNEMMDGRRDMEKLLKQAGYLRDQGTGAT